MNNVGKPALDGLTQPTIGTFFQGNRLNLFFDKFLFLIGNNFHHNLCSHEIKTHLKELCKTSILLVKS
jgi:hypothetical protein